MVTGVMPAVVVAGPGAAPAGPLSAEPGIEVLNDVVFNQVAVRFGDSDEQTHAVISAVQAEGTCWAGGASWHGRAVMRWSVSNWSTTPDDIDRSAQAVINAHRAETNRPAPR